MRDRHRSNWTITAEVAGQNDNVDRLVVDLARYRFLKIDVQGY